MDSTLKPATSMRAAVSAVQDSSPTAQTLITVKVIVGETTRRFKLPYSLLSSEQLPAKLRELLNMSSSQVFKIERFSDSAKSFIDLETKDSNVYKQLQRAAKAKGKIRLRVTYPEDKTEPTSQISAASTMNATSTPMVNPSMPKYDASRRVTLPSTDVQPLVALTAKSDGVQQSASTLPAERAGYVPKCLQPRRYPQVLNDRLYGNQMTRDTTLDKMSISAALAPSVPESGRPDGPTAASYVAYRRSLENPANTAPVVLNCRPQSTAFTNKMQVDNRMAEANEIAKSQNQLLHGLQQQREIIEAQKRQMIHIAKSTPNFAPAVSNRSIQDPQPPLKPRTIRCHNSPSQPKTYEDVCHTPNRLDADQSCQGVASASQGIKPVSSLPSGLSLPIRTLGDRSTQIANMSTESTSAQSNTPAMCPGRKPLRVSQSQIMRLYCDACNDNIVDAHYHCSQCNDGDFDLCILCVDKSHHCFDSTHWMVKRTLQNGKIVNSVTEKCKQSPRSLVDDDEHKSVHPYGAACVIEAKQRPTLNIQVDRLPTSTKPSVIHPTEMDIKPIMETVTDAVFFDGDAQASKSSNGVSSQRLMKCRYEPKTSQCKACDQQILEAHAAVCADCPNYTICARCLRGGAHGHHPGHSYRSKQPGMVSKVDAALLQAMHYKEHNAICDKCDKRITGVRHKCIDCPDFDLCSSCISDASSIHQNHRFIPSYDDIPHLLGAKSRHLGIFCDGPGCAKKDPQTYIRGARYKCAICHDLDFCEDCESSPANGHNKTHPLIKFKTPVGNASITTFDESNKEIIQMGDRSASSQLDIPVHTSVTAESSPAQPIKHNTPLSQQEHSIDWLKSKHENSTRLMTKLNALAELRKQPELTLAFDAIFVYDTITDGTIFRPEQFFTQRWAVKNPGPLAWPAGCYVEYTGGEGRQMSINKSSNLSPTGLRLSMRSEKTSQEVKPGEECHFTVNLQAPKSTGKKISYWRVCSPMGDRFGHKLWCDIEVSRHPTLAARFPITIPKRSRSPVKLADYCPIDPALENIGTPSGPAQVEQRSSVGEQTIEYVQSAQKQPSVYRHLAALKAKHSDQTATRSKPDPAECPPYSPTQSSSDSQLLFPKLEKESPQSSVWTRSAPVTTAHIPAAANLEKVVAEKEAAKLAEVKETAVAKAEKVEKVEIAATAEKATEEPAGKMEEVDLKDPKVKDDDLLGSDVEYETIGDGSGETDEEDFEWNTDDEYEILDSAMEELSKAKKM